ncbi:MAG: TenA family protein [Muribaculum sp.]|nr:TenA family protein [Muribaculaceae bacterium]MCM1081549.1 TenA family protein [Muribaculum sp.]
MKPWSEKAWEAASSIYEAILQQPFIKQLAQGSLERDKFLFYLRQDALYIDNYAKVLAHIASRLTNRSHVASFVKFAQDGIDVEKAMHESFLAGVRPDKTDISPSCMLYTSVLSAQANAPVEVEAAAVLPCFWVYQKVGQTIVSNSTPHNPYKMWIDTYADPMFEQSTLKAIAICDELADAAGEATSQAMTEIFKLCTKMEWLFWNSAWNLEKWEI